MKPTASQVRCRVLCGGELGERKGINLPDSRLTIAAPTEKDIADLALGIELGVDFVALSFVASAADIERLREAMQRIGGPGCRIPIIAKIERPQALDNLEEITAAADGVMVARGDLGIEMPTEDVPAAQKRIIRCANRLARPVITATQMLESMIVNPRPTRAEAADVANAVLDGTDAVMLSGETSIGAYPLESVRIMDRIARRAEAMRREMNATGADTQQPPSALFCHSGRSLQPCPAASCRRHRGIYHDRGNGNKPFAMPARMCRCMRSLPTAAFSSACRSCGESARL